MLDRVGRAVTAEAAGWSGPGVWESSFRLPGSLATATSCAYRDAGHSGVADK